MRKKVWAGLAWIRAHLPLLALGGIAVAVLVLVRLAYLNPQDPISQFSGLPARSIVKDSQPAKTLWDWADLLIVPLVLAMVGLLYSRRERQVEREVADKQRALEQQIAERRAMDDALKSYLDAMERLLTDKGLSEPEPPEHVRNLARAYTLTVLDRVDGRRKGAVVRFLYEAKLIGTSDETDSRDSKLRMDGANLQEAWLIEAMLSGACLPRVDLSRAVLSEAHLEDANLEGARIISANLGQAYLGQAKLRAAILFSSDLEGIDMKRADLRQTAMPHTNLKNANLAGTNMEQVYLEGANLEGVCLKGVRNLTQLQLDDTQSYHDAMDLPDHLTPDPRPWPRDTSPAPEPGPEGDG